MAGEGDAASPAIRLGNVVENACIESFNGVSGSKA